jgi:hypothetical protein
MISAAPHGSPPISTPDARRLTPPMPMPMPSTARSGWLLALLASTLLAAAPIRAHAREQGIAPVGSPGGMPPPPQERAQEPAPVAPASVPTTNRFDGDWTIRIDCPLNAEPSGAKGDRVDFPASILNGRLFGSRGPQGAPGSLQVEGTIAPDGSATLQAHGRTAGPDDAANAPAPGTAYSYDIQARFDGASGTGKRQQQRACDVAFTRR